MAPILKSTAPDCADEGTLLTLAAPGLSATVPMAVVVLPGPPAPRIDLPLAVLLDAPPPPLALPLSAVCGFSGALASGSPTVTSVWFALRSNEKYVAPAITATTPIPTPQRNSRIILAC